MRTVWAGSLLLLVAFGIGVATARADSVLCTEDFFTGCQATLGTVDNQGHGLSITFGSDGEGGFDPFNFGADQSDVIWFKGDFASLFTLVGGGASVGSLQDATSCDQLGWFAGSSSGQWAMVVCGENNAVVYEPVGHWLAAGHTWADFGIATGTYSMNDSADEGGGISDSIVLFDDANGANVTFASDPANLANPEPVPEPGTMLLLGTGIASILARRRIFVA